MQNPLVSVIVPVYNRSNIKNTIDSIINQHYRNIEIIIVNDGSSKDVSLALKMLVNGYHDDRIVYLQQENQGPSSARNKGLKHSKGMYVCYLDSDDIMLPSRIDSQIYSMLENNADLSIAGIHYERRNIDVVPAMIPSDKGLHNFLLNENNIFIGTQAWIFKKDMLLRIGGYDEQMWNYEDCDLVFRYLSQKGVVLSVVPKVLTLYRDYYASDRLTNLKNTKNSHFIYGFITFYANVLEYILTSNAEFKRAYLKANYKKFLKMVAHYREEIDKMALLEKVYNVNDCIKQYDKFFYYSNQAYYLFCKFYYRF